MIQRIAVGSTFPAADLEQTTQTGAEDLPIWVDGIRRWRRAPLLALKNIAHKKTPAAEKPLLDRFFPEKR
jgi:hypothetical protein